MAQSLDNLSRTWSDAGTTFTAVKYNVTDSGSAAGSLLLDFQINSASRAAITKQTTRSGSVTGGQLLLSNSTNATQVSLGFDGNNVPALYGTGGHMTVRTADFVSQLNVNTVGVHIGTSTGVLSFNGGYGASSLGDTILARDAANTLALRNAGNPQQFNFYNSYTDVNNYDRGYLRWQGNALQLGTSILGSFTTARDLQFQTNGTTRLTIGTTGNVTFNGQVTVSTASNIFTINQGAGAGGIFSLYHFGSSIGASCRSDAYWGWSSTTSADATADVVMKRGGAGILTLGNAATITDFNRLQFGGTTSSYPSLKRNSAALQVRLADDSADAPITASTFTSTSAPVNTSAIAATGYSLTGTSAVSMVDLEGAWNTTGTPTLIKANVTSDVSNAASLLMDLRVAGASKFSVRKDGLVVSASGARFSNFNLGTSGSSTWFALAPTGAMGWFVSDVTSGTFDLSLFRDAANTLAQRNGTNAQTFRVYNTYTDASNYERGYMRWNSNVFEIGGEVLGSGTARTLKVMNSTTIQITPSNAVLQVDANIRPTSNGSNNLGTDSVRWATTFTANVVQSGYQELAEMTAPAAPAANGVRIYAEDDGAGKTRLMALFATGAAVQIAIEP